MYLIFDWFETSFCSLPIAEDGPPGSLRFLICPDLIGPMTPTLDGGGGGGGVCYTANSSTNQPLSTNTTLPLAAELAKYSSH